MSLWRRNTRFLKCLSPQAEIDRPCSRTHFPQHLLGFIPVIGADDLVEEQSFKPTYEERPESHRMRKMHVLDRLGSAVSRHFEPPGKKLRVSA